jgi:hypothetical protein
MWTILDDVPTEILFTFVGAASISILRYLYTSLRKTIYDRNLDRKNQSFASKFKNNVFSIGGVTSSIFISDFQPRGYSPDSLTCELVLEAESIPSIQNEEFEKALEKWRESEKLGKIFNGQVFALQNFRFPRSTDFEQPGLHLVLRPSDYVTQRATGDAFRSLPSEQRASEADYARENPGSGGRFSATFGTPVVVVTADNQLMWLKRSGISAVNAGRYTCTTAEGLNRDDLRSGSPDPYLCAARGLHEEIGIRLNTDELSKIRFVAMLLDLDWWEWTLVGIIHLSQLSEHSLDSKTLRQYFSSARPKDKWETGQPDFCDFTPNGVALFIKDHSVTNYGAVGAVLALMSSGNFRREEIFKAFRNINLHIGDFEVFQY